MRRLFGALLIVVGVLGPTAAIWWLFASGYMEERPYYGPRAFAGPIMFGAMCILIGIALWVVPRKSS